MQKIILNIMLISVLGLMLPACSKKTTDQVNANEQPRQQRRGNQQKGERPQFADLLLQMDSNKDGKLSKAEVNGPLKNDFSKIDKDTDGFISEAEFKAAPLPQRRRRN
jgi:hypothetical protein